MNKSKLFLNQKGVSLVEVMVAAGISSVIALGTMKINETSQQGMRNVATKSELNNYVNFKIGSALGESTACLGAFDTDGNGTPGNTISLTLNGSADIKKIQVGSLELAEVGKQLPGTSGEFNVDKISFRRDAGTACTLTLDLSRNKADRKIGGKHLKKEIAMGCAFDDTGSNELQTCSTKGTSELGKWSYLDSSGATWLQNEEGAASIGTYNPAGGSAYPVPRLVVTPDNANTNDWNGLEDAIGLPGNYVIRWGQINTTDNGVGIYSDGSDCFKVKDGSATDHFETCRTGGTKIRTNTNVTGTLTSSGALTVSGGGAVINGSLQARNGIVVTGLADINGNTDISGTTTSGGKLTVNSGGALIKGNTRIEGKLDVVGGAGASIYGDTQITGTTYSNQKMTVASGGLDVLSGNLKLTNGSATISNVIHSNGKGVFNSLFVAGIGVASAWNTHSDRRFKENIEPLDEPLQKILSLEPVQYDWRGAYTPKFGDKKQLGLIAQDVKKVYPDIVNEDEKGFLSVNYTALIAPIIDSVKSLYNKIVENDKKDLERDRKIASLEAENKELKERLERLEGLVLEKK